VMMIAIYTFVFSDVFKLRWAGASDSKTLFATMVFAGLIVHGLFAECLVQGPTVITRNPTFVKKIIFPLEILPWVTVLAALFHTAVGTAVLCAFILVTKGQISPNVLWVPLVFLPLVLMAVGLSWFLASAGVYFRDVAQVTSAVSMVLLFLSPVLYPASALPERLQPLFALNPLTPAIEQVRRVLVLGEPLLWTSWITQLAIGFLVAWLGLSWFQKMREIFSDVL
jgi:homopolymeric O-antigen transport system permease protein